MDVCVCFCCWGEVRRDQRSHDKVWKQTMIACLPKHFLIITISGATLYFHLLYAKISRAVHSSRIFTAIYSVVVPEDKESQHTELYLFNLKVVSTCR